MRLFLECWQLACYFTLLQLTTGFYSPQQQTTSVICRKYHRREASPFNTDSMFVNGIFFPSHCYKRSVVSLNLRQLQRKSPDIDDTKDFLSYTKESLQTTAAILFGVSAPLGMFLDNLHGQFGVLFYEQRGIPLSLTIGDFGFLKTALWVPILFGFAGIVMSLLAIIFDKQFKTAHDVAHPSWTKTIASISVFSFQYFLSGLLDYNHVASLYIHAILAVFAVVGFYLFDGSQAGFLLALATTIAGPVVEVLLINVPQLYHYTNADWMGICSWIPWVYFLGAPAVGNLTRKVHAQAKATQSDHIPGE